MAVIAETQRESFEDRLQRIAAGGPNTTSTIYIGNIEPAPEPKGKKRSRRKARGKNAAPSKLGFLAPLVSWPFAFLVGALAMLAGRIAAYQLSMRPDILPPDWANLLMLVADFGIAAVLMILLGWIFRMGGMKRAFLCAGFVAVIVAEPMLIQQAPDVFVPLFSDAYVTAQLSAVPPMDQFAATMDAFRDSEVLLPDLVASAGI